MMTSGFKENLQIWIHLFNQSFGYTASQLLEIGPNLKSES